MRCQSIPVDHAIYLNGGEDTRELYRDLQSPHLFLHFGPPATQHDNYVHALRILPHQGYDLFCKIDDDDIYETTYIEGVVNDFLEHQWDYSGSFSNGVIRGRRWLPRERWQSLGLTDFDRELSVIEVMPSTAAFSRHGIECVLGLADTSKALNLDWRIDEHYEDVGWRRAIARTSLRQHVRQESRFIYHIHGGNVSTGSWLEPGEGNDAGSSYHPSLLTPSAEKRSQRKALEYDQLLDILSKANPSGPFFLQSAKMLDEYIAPKGYPPRETNLGPPKRLTIGMATYDDWDGVYFSVQTIRLFHPEVTDQTEILVIDNHAGSKASSQLADLANWVKNYRYVPATRPTGTAAKDLVFRYSNTEYVLCMDGHVLFAPGSLAALLGYLEANPGTRNLLQGPMVSDDLTSISTHWDPKWSGGMCGTWGEDKRGADPSAPPFAIPLHGLGMFACRRDAWLGFNPRFRGFGGDEGYIHEKFRKAGAVTLCLPFLRWLHRFGRPEGAPYNPRYLDSIRNFLIGHRELGLDPAPMIRHFEEMIGADAVREIVDAVRKEIQSPFDFFEAIYCINVDGQEERWDRAMEEFRRLGIAEVVQRFPAVETPHHRHIGCALSHRAILTEARRRGLRNILVLEDDVVFAPDAVEVLRQNLAELPRLKETWPMLYLGGATIGQKFDKAPECQHLELAWVTCTHAIAYSNAVYDCILADVPDNPTEVALWCREHFAIDRYYLEKFGGSALITSPVATSQLNLLAHERFPASVYGNWRVPNF